MLPGRLITPNIVQGKKMPTLTLRTRRCWQERFREVLQNLAAKNVIKMIEILLIASEALVSCSSYFGSIILIFEIDWVALSLTVGHMPHNQEVVG